MPATALPALNLPSELHLVERSAEPVNDFVPTNAELVAALETIESGQVPDRRQAETLLHARGPHLDRLLGVAGRVRDEGLEIAGRPGVITYSRKVFIPLTHLCQDRCHYCIFVKTPGKLTKEGKAPFLSEDEVLEIARQGAALGCKEALFTLGDRPEARWSVAREWLDEHGHASTLDYMAHLARRVLEETGLLPHLNPGVMSWTEIQRLKPVAPSMGMMLETTATRLWSEKGGPHYGSPDKDPAVRLQVLEDAGRSKVPFTTGVLLGIGENYAERIDAMLALREVAERHGNVQEVIVQNFRAKEATAMMRADDLETQEYVAAVAVTKVVLGPTARIQAPPNLTDADELALLIRAGIDDWGGVSPLTPDHVNPERPWPQIDELARLTGLSGYRLRERLTAHPHFLREGAPWIDPRLAAHVDALIDPESGLAREEAMPAGLPWSESLMTPRNDGPALLSSDVLATLRVAESDPAGLSDTDYEALLGASGPNLDALTALADAVRADAVGDAVTFAVNRNLDSSLDLSLDSVSELADEAWSLGATEICMQGAVGAGLAATRYLDLARAVKRDHPDVHLHAYRPIELLDGSRRAEMSLSSWLDALREAGVDSVPGTGARILDDRIRSVLSGGTELGVETWTATITAAHRAGLRSTATMVYGHLETPAHQVAHLRALTRIQDETGGFAEFIPMPFVAADASSGVLALLDRRGPNVRETRAVHAVARLMLHGRIAHVQAAWTKLGVRLGQTVLQGGADDFGGILVDGTLNPDAGPETGRSLTISDVERLASELGRPVRQRLTDYGTPNEERLAAARTAVLAVGPRL